jgi:hypothetical protein
MEGDPGERSFQKDAKVLPPLTYEPNPKHKPVPTPGRHGSICPTDADGPSLLLASRLVGTKRYATDGMNAYCAQQHRAEQNLWHGYPVGWDEVPPIVVGEWVASGTLDRRVVRRARKSRQR